MAPPTLVRMTLNYIIRHINEVYDLSNVPENLAMEIVNHACTAQQLHSLELSNPEIATKTGDLWRFFIKRDMPDLKPEHMYEPKNPLSWHKVYKRIKREQDEREAAQEEALRKTILGAQVKKAEKQAVFVDRILAHNGVRNKRQSGVNDNQISVTRAKTGTQAIAAIRRQAAQNSRQMSRAQVTQATPTPSQQIRQAPASMVRELNQRGHLEIQPRELAPHQREMLRENRRLQASTVGLGPGRLTTAKHADSAQRRNAAAIEEALQIKEDKIRALKQRENVATASKTAAKKFEFEPTPVMTTTGYDLDTSLPQSGTHNAPPPQEANAASSSPVKQIHASLSPPSSLAQGSPHKPIVIKKRAPPTNIFMSSNKKVKR